MATKKIDLKKPYQLFEEARKIYATFNYLDGSELDFDATPKEKLECNQQIIEIAKILEKYV